MLAPLWLDKLVRTRYRSGLDGEGVCVGEVGVVVEDVVVVEVDVGDVNGDV